MPATRRRVAAGHRPGKAGGRAAAGLRRPRRRHCGVQPQPARAHQPRARRRLCAAELRARGPVPQEGAPHRNAPPLVTKTICDDSRGRLHLHVGKRRDDLDGGLPQVPRRRDPRHGRAHGLRVRRAMGGRRVALRREPLDRGGAGRALMTPLVSFRNVSCRLGGKDVLRELSLDVEAGETLVLLGRSGSGKTTALKMVNALLLPSAGEVRVEGTPTAAWDAIRLRRRIGYVIQEAGLFPHFTVEQNVGLVPRLEAWPAEKIRARVRALLEQVELPPAQFAARYPRELSGGQRQRVGVARALAADPPLLLFDEPFGALDPVTRVELQRQFLALRREIGKTAIFVTHDVREALLVATRIALLHDGRLDVLATPAEFLRAPGEEVRAFLACLDTQGIPA